MRLKQVWLGVVAVLVGLAVLGGCSTSGGIAVDAGTVVVDVRTPQEYAQGHLDGATNIDVESPDFAQQVAQLDPKTHYVVYCHSGNRASVAVDYMKQQGFGNVVNAGGIQAASSATGLKVVS